MKLSDAAYESLEGDMMAGNTTLGNCSVGLAMVAPPNRPQSLSDITEANFTGYGRISLPTPSAPYKHQSGEIGMTCPSVVFAATAPAGNAPFVGNTIFGKFVYNETKQLLVCYEPIKPPTGVEINAPGAQVEVVVDIGFDPNQIAGQGGDIS